ncbi:MAG TPA: UDP-N-acetylglucosamine 2-epimerase (non-hydrolyzing) [Anaeromyxobacteraceae bacterium]|nr:UDP-N-acetylglucosamine 2-epimerase (non-hydrolyzing) [Anaeromyxobacteraceae bacterium]
MGGEIAPKRCATATRPVAAVVIGTRPEAIKLAPVVSALRGQGAFEPVVISTGQHRQMLDQALAVFDLKPDVELEVMSPGQTLHDITARTLERMRAALSELAPARVIVQGDTTTAFAAALAAFYAKLPVAHVEAGLRSGERYSPFPEEINRRMVDQLSDLLFAPTRQAADLLAREGFPHAAIHVTGNTVVDALLATRAVVRRRGLEIPGLPPGWLDGVRMVLVTAHRRESFGPGIEGVCRAMLRIVRAVPDARVVYPVHLNPSVDVPVRRILGAEPRILLLPPVPYLEFVALMDRAHLVLTDSGGVQEEAPTFGKPVLVMRDVTERPEGIAAGVARLVGTSEDRIAEEAIRLLLEPGHYAEMAVSRNPYGDGHAAERIARILAAEHAVPGARVEVQVA